ncbi:MAG: PaaI family thioesterase [Variovorax sp.]|nr:MAG: PaaI family thioesterase [Variovorax sp.]
MLDAVHEKPALAVPAGYIPIVSRARGFVQRCGGFHLHATQPVLATRVTADHLNPLDIAHGGFLATLADTAFGAVIKRDLGLAAPPATVSLSVDYIGAVREGDWVEAHVEVHKTGRRLSNASCLVKVGDRVVLRASGVFITTLKGDAP